MFRKLLVAAMCGLVSYTNKPGATTPTNPAPSTCQGLEGKEWALILERNTPLSTKQALAQGFLKP